MSSYFSSPERDPNWGIQGLDGMDDLMLAHWIYLSIIGSLRYLRDALPKVSYRGQRGIPLFDKYAYYGKMWPSLELGADYSSSQPTTINQLISEVEALKPRTMAQINTAHRQRTGTGGAAQAAAIKGGILATAGGPLAAALFSAGAGVSSLALSQIRDVTSAKKYELDRMVVEQRMIAKAYFIFLLKLEELYQVKQLGNAKVWGANSFYAQAKYPEVKQLHDALAEIIRQDRGLCVKHNSGKAKRPEICDPKSKGYRSQLVQQHRRSLVENQPRPAGVSLLGQADRRQKGKAKSAKLDLNREAKALCQGKHQKWATSKGTTKPLLCALRENRVSPQVLADLTIGPGTVRAADSSVASVFRRHPSEVKKLEKFLEDLRESDARKEKDRIQEAAAERSREQAIRKVLDLYDIDVYDALAYVSPKEIKDALTTLANTPGAIELLEDEYPPELFNNIKAWQKDKGIVL
jgi:hypothetical protein